MALCLYLSIFEWRNLENLEEILNGEMKYYSDYYCRFKKEPYHEYCCGNDQSLNINSEWATILYVIETISTFNLIYYENEYGYILEKSVERKEIHVEETEMDWIIRIERIIEKLIKNEESIKKRKEMKYIEWIPKMKKILISIFCEKETEEEIENFIKKIDSL